jgi:hypothetical protein
MPSGQQVHRPSTSRGHWAPPHAPRLLVLGGADCEDLVATAPPEQNLVLAGPAWLWIHRFNIAPTGAFQTREHEPLVCGWVDDAETGSR